MYEKYKKSNLNISIRHDLAYNVGSKSNIDNKDPINLIVNNISDIYQMVKVGTIKIITFLYFNRKTIEKILYDKEDIFFVQTDSVNDRQSDYFYFSLLIQDNPILLNYIYSIDLIEKIAKKNKAEINSFLKLINSKIVIELVYNYENSDTYDEDKEKDLLDKIIKENDYIIKKNKNSFKELNIDWTMNDIKKKKIDDIYSEIILALIKTKKIDDFKYAEDLLIQLDFKNIMITKTIYEKLSELLDSNENYIKYYNIENINELISQTKQNFYYLLLVYIIKDPFYIYQIPFLYKIRRKLLVNIKNNNYKEQNQKINKILEIFDLKYYLLKFYDKIKNPNSINGSTKNNSIEDKIKDGNEIIVKHFMEKILNESIFILNNNQDNKFHLRLIMDDDEKEEKFENKIKKKKDEEKNSNIDILKKNFDKLMDFLKTVLEKIKSEFHYEYNLLIKLIIRNEGYNKKNNPLLNIKCIYFFYEPYENDISSYKDENILINGINSTDQGFFFLLNDINRTEYKGIQYKHIDVEKRIKEEIEKNNRKEEKIKRDLSLLDIPNNVSKLKIIEFKEKIGSHSSNDNKITTAEFIKPLSNNFFISGGNQNLYIYKEYKLQIIIYLNNCPTNIFEIKNDNENILQIIICSKDNNKLITYEIDMNQYHIDYFEIYSSLFIEMNENNYIISNIKGTFISNTMKNIKQNELKKISNYHYKVGIKINDKIIALTSNDIIPKGNNKLILYNIESKESEYEIGGKSFSININSLLLIIDKKNFCKQLICACKKYTSNQKNEILLINIKNEDNIEVNEFFYNTSDFEPYCFCNIFYKNNDKSIQTNYILVGGFSTKKIEGEIQLYKITNKEDVYLLEFIQTLYFDNDEKTDFNGAITCITQSEINGNILISCSNGNVYLFSPPNINYFLFYDEEEESNHNYDEIIYNDENINKIENKNNKKEENNPIYNNKQIFTKLLKIKDYKKYSDIFE